MNMRNNKFSDDQRAAIIRDYLGGVPVARIMERYGCSSSYPRFLTRRRGIAARPVPRITKDSYSLTYEAWGWQRAREIGAVIA